MVPFVENQEMILGERTFALAGGRLNGDGLDDLVAHVGWGQVRVFLNRGDGSMSNYWERKSAASGLDSDSTVGVNCTLV